MNFYSVRDLRTETKKLGDNLSAGGEVVITNNGKPAAILNAVISRRFSVCYDYRILDEYNKVLRRRLNKQLTASSPYGVCHIYIESD